jgi:hypothetical protein
MRPGTYAFRFAGYAMDDNGTPYHLVGVGQIWFAADGKLGGLQSSAVTALTGFEHQVRTARYELIGDYAGGDDGIGQAFITFTSTEQILKSSFDFVDAGPDRIFMISSGGVRTTSGGKPLPTDVPTDELVSGEAVRIGDFPLGPG